MIKQKHLFSSHGNVFSLCRKVTRDVAVVMSSGSEFHSLAAMTRKASCQVAINFTLLLTVLDYYSVAVLCHHLPGGWLCVAYCLLCLSVYIRSWSKLCRGLMRL